MIRQSVGRAASWAQLCAALLLAVAGARFGVAGLLFAVRAQAPELSSATSPAPPAPASAIAPVPPPTGPTVKVGAALRVPIVVNAKQERSEVRVDGVRVGHSPYVGEVSCKAGEQVKIDVLPPQGVPLSFERRCAPGTLHIDP